MSEPIVTWSTNVGMLSVPCEVPVPGPAKGPVPDDPFDPGEPWIHTTATVDPGVSLGRGTKVYQYATVRSGVRTGTNCVIGSASYIGVHVVFGDDVRVQHGAFLPDRTQCGHRVFIGPNATFTDDRNPVVNNPLYKREPPIIEDDVSIGAGATILPGVRLRQGCMIGAGAIVTKDVLPHVVVVGNPAREVSRP